MFAKQNTIQKKILGGFLSLTFVMLIIISFSTYQLTRTEGIRDFEKQIDNLQIVTLYYFENAHAFMQEESINLAYFKSNQSIPLHNMDSIYSIIETELNTIENSVGTYGFPIETEIKEVRSSLMQYRNAFETLVAYTNARGFKDFGKEGEMRRYAHQLEEFPDFISGRQVLTLRRHEKDYMLRNDISYAQELNALSGVLIRAAQNERKKDTIVSLLQSYTAAFNELVEIEKVIGNNSNTGLQFQLKQQNYLAVAAFRELTTKTSIHAGNVITTGKWIYLTAIAASVLFSFVISYFVSKKLSKPIKRLSNFIQTSIEQNKISEYKPLIKHKDTEIGLLAYSFQKLMKQTRHQVYEINEQTSLLTEQNETLRKLNSELDHFLYSTAHDLRSPLTSLLGLLNLAQMDNKQASLENYFDMMKSSVKKMEGFIAELVDYAKNKNQILVNQKIELGALVKDIYENHRYYPNANRIKFTVKEDTYLPFYSDFTRLKIIMTNLISNAIRYMDTGKSTPFINIHLTTDKSITTLVISDNGIGIGKKHLNKIFEMFYRASENSRGSGLGLFILREALLKLNGKIKVESEIGIGTVFTLAIPNQWGAAVTEEEILPVKSSNSDVNKTKVTA